MRKIKTLIAASVILLMASAFTFLRPEKWIVKSNYSIKITNGLHAEFKTFKAGIVFDEEHPEKSVLTATIDAASIETGKPLMNEHAKEKDGLDAAKYPYITFASTNVSKTMEGYIATGNLTLKDVTREVKIPFYFSSTKNSNRFPFPDKETFAGKFAIKPKEFNVTRQGVPDEIVIELLIPVIH